MAKGKSRQYLIFFLISFIFAPIIIDHQIILDANFVFARTSIIGWLITGVATFVALIMLEWSFNINKKITGQIMSRFIFIMLLAESPWLLSQGMKASVRKNTSAEPTLLI